MRKGFHGVNRTHSPGLLRQFYRWARGTEQLLLRPAHLPLVLISYAKSDRDGVERFQESVGETWVTLPQGFRDRYKDVIEIAPPLIVVQMRRRNVCTCLGHHHPPGTEGRLTRKLRDLSGVRTGELDLAYEAIRDWEPLPLSHHALPTYANNSEELSASQWQLALLAVFLHELHHLVDPREAEHVVRQRSQTFYVDALTHFVSERFGVEYGLRRGIHAVR